MPYRIGAEVRVTTIGKVGRVMSVSRSGRYRILVGGMEVACREDELEEPSNAGRRQAVRRPAPSGPLDLVGRPSASDRARLGSIDLHGASVEEALRSVEARVDEALRAGLDHLDIIHGVGTGKVRHAVHQLLGHIGAVRHFEIIRWNRGVTRAYF